MEPTYDERPRAEVERIFDELLLRGILRGVPADGGGDALPEGCGPTIRTLARRFRSVTMTEVDIVIYLSEGGTADDSLGGWRLTASPEEIDVRVMPGLAVGDGAEGDAIIDATWSPHADDVAVHSTILHFLVRAAVGDRA